MYEIKIPDKKGSDSINKKLFEYSQELVMLNYLFELKLLSKDEMQNIKRDIMVSYNVKGDIVNT